MTYASNFQFASSDQPFRDAVAGAMVKAALDINGEAQNGMSDTLFRSRSGLAYDVLRGTSNYVSAFAQAVKLANPTYTSATADSDLFNAVAAVWNDIAVPLATT